MRLRLPFNTYRYRVVYAMSA